MFEYLNSLLNNVQRSALGSCNTKKLPHQTKMQPTPTRPFMIVWKRIISSGF